VRLGQSIVCPVEIGKVSAVLAARHPGLAGIMQPAFEAAEPLVDVSREPGLAELTVADDVDAGFGMPAHDFGYAFAQAFGKSVLIVRLLVDQRAHGVDDLYRACQAADVSRENSFPCCAAWLFRFRLWINLALLDEQSC
jgi:hypothetical protein